MSVNWQTILDNMGNELIGSDNLMTKQYTDSRGATKVYRDIQDIAYLDQVIKNKQVEEDRETEGLFGLAERDFL